MYLTKKSLIIAALGTMLEYYDYAIFSIFLPIIAPVFFPARSKYDALVMGFNAVLIAAIARPLGGLIIGYIGDRFGRKVALLISIYGIAIATLLIGFTPGYLVIGIWSMIIITFVRSIQMFCFGGEYSGAGIYVIELANGRREGLVSGFLAAMALTGSVIASLVGMAITYHNKAAPNWRFAFILGGLIGLIAIIYRKDMDESISKLIMQDKVLLRALFTNYPSSFFSGMCIGGFVSLPFTTVFTFINPILLTKGYINNSHFMLIQFILSFVAVFTLLISGSLADKYTPLKIMKCGAFLLIVMCIPLCYMLESKKLLVILVAEILMIIINEILFGPSNAFLKSIFPVNLRYRGVAFSFCLGMAIVGGLTPIVENALYSYTNHIAAISLWLFSISSLTLFSINKVKPI